MIFIVGISDLVAEGVVDHLAHVVCFVLAVRSCCITVESFAGSADAASLIGNLKKSVPKSVVCRVLLITIVPFEGRDTDNGDEIKQAGKGACPHGKLLSEVGRLAEREDIGGVDGEIGKLVERSSPVISLKVVEGSIESIHLGGQSFALGEALGVICGKVCSINIWVILHAHEEVGDVYAIVAKSAGHLFYSLKSKIIII